MYARAFPYTKVFLLSLPIQPSQTQRHSYLQKAYTYLLSFIAHEFYCNFDSVHLYFAHLFCKLDYWDLLVIETIINYQVPAN